MLEDPVLCDLNTRITTKNALTIHHVSLALCCLLTREPSGIVLYLPWHASVRGMASSEYPAYWGIRLSLYYPKWDSNSGMPRLTFLEYIVIVTTNHL